MLSEHIKDVFHHMEWADATAWSAVMEFDAAARDEYVAETMFHIHQAQHSFLNVWLGKPMERVKREDFATVRDICAWGEQFHRDVAVFLESVTDSRMDEPCVLPWAAFFSRTLGRDPDETTLQDVLHQLPSHSMHHRGQVIRRIRELGQKPPLVEFIAWAWAGRPSAEWPE